MSTDTLANFSNRFIPFLLEIQFDCVRRLILLDVILLLFPEYRKLNYSFLIFASGFFIHVYIQWINVFLASPRDKH